MPLRAVELFAGIGGGSLALKAAGIKTAAYCEKDPFCQQVLTDNMDRGRLDRAPIFDDVQELSGSDIKGNVDVLAGGFPCTGLSSIGVRKGLYGDTRSKLVKHVYRLADELQPTYIFLENTPLITSDRNYGRLISQLHRRNYECAFIINSASQCGASHRRRRWFLLAIKQGAPPLKVSDNALEKLQNHFRQKVSNKTENRNWKKASLTCGVFGNCVCPAQAASALQVLSDTFKIPRDELVRTTMAKMKLMLPTFVASNKTVYQDHDFEPASDECVGKGFDVVPPRKKSPLATSPQVKKPYFNQCHPTPRTGSNCATCSPAFTERTRLDAGQFLLSSKQMYSGKIPTMDERKQRIVSEKFWAASMGFPSDWITGSLEIFMNPEPSESDSQSESD